MLRVQRNFGKLVRQLAAESRGVSSVEFGIILSLIALGTMQAMSSLGVEVKSDINHTESQVAANRVNADPFARAAGSGSNGGGANEPAPASAPPMAPANYYSPDPTAPEVAPQTVSPEW